MSHSKNFGDLIIDMHSKIETIYDYVDLSSQNANEIWLGASPFGLKEASVIGFDLPTSVAETFGSTVELLQAGDTPRRPGNLRFDVNRVFVTAVTSTEVFIVRLLYGTGTDAEAEAAGQYTDVPLMSTGAGTNSQGDPTSVIFKRVPIGTKVWAQAKTITPFNTISIIFGISEYI